MWVSAHAPCITRTCRLLIFPRLIGLTMNTIPEHNSLSSDSPDSIREPLSNPGQHSTIATDPGEMKSLLRQVERPLWYISDGKTSGLTPIPPYENNGHFGGNNWRLIAALPAVPLDSLGSPEFNRRYGLSAAYYAGAMANGISSEQVLIALGQAGLMGSFGAAGLPRDRLESAIRNIQTALGDRPYAFNLINSPNEPALEARAADLYVQHGVRVTEASAYLDMTFPLVYYRAAGLSQSPDGRIVIGNRVIAKLSRREVARRFMDPAPEDILAQLVADGRITETQANLARQVPMADDITVEADSGGHTDNRPLVCLLPSLLALRDEVQSARRYPQTIGIGAAGGISTPSAALAALMMGADYIVTGSINQASVESGASVHTRSLLAQADMADVIMAPSADMFEMGVKVQLLKRGTLFPMRAQKLYEIYTRYDSIDDIPATEREKLENQIFRRDLNAVWEDTVRFFRERDPSQIDRAERDPKQKMALVFRWYLGLSSRWSVNGEKGREMDYQIWCGPAMGAFNDWVRGSYLEQIENRRAADMALHLLTGAAYLYRVQLLRMQGIRLPAGVETYLPEQPLIA